MENQSLRRLRRQLDYGKRARGGEGMAELYQWLGRILLDDGLVYSLEERALAFEIAACERLAELWPELHLAEPESLVVSGPLDRLLLYRQLLSGRYPPPRRAALYRLLHARYPRYADWIESRAAASDGTSGLEASGCLLLLEQFLAGLEALEALPEELGSADLALRAELTRLQEEERRRGTEISTLHRDLEFAEDRAERAHQRLRLLDEEARQLRRDLREFRENGEKLRTERRTRIESVRQSSQSQRDLARLQADYARLEQRLQSMAQRLAAAEQRPGGSPEVGELRVTVGALRRLEPGQVLGLAAIPTGEELSQIRRRFAAVFHPDRVNGLPPWVRILCDEILGAVNEACDRAEADQG